jgi:hypothetical protein
LRPAFAFVSKGLRTKEKPDRRRSDRARRRGQPSRVSRKPPPRRPRPGPGEALAVRRG